MKHKNFFVSFLFFFSVQREKFSVFNYIRFRCLMERSHKDPDMKVYFIFSGLYFQSFRWPASSRKRPIKVELIPAINSLKITFRLRLLAGESFAMTNDLCHF